MAVVTILSNATRGSLTSPAMAVPSSAPKYIRVAITSPTFATDPSLVWDLLVEQSFDSGTHWQPWFTSTNVGGGGLAVQTTWFDGTARQLRATVNVPTPFVWGLTGEVVTL